MKLFFGALFWLVGVPMTFAHNSNFLFDVVGIGLIVATLFFYNARFFAFVGGVISSALGAVFLYVGITQSLLTDVLTFSLGVVVFGALVFFGKKLPLKLDSSIPVIVIGTGIAALGSSLLRSSLVFAIPLGLLICIYGFGGFWAAFTNRTVPEVWRHWKRRYVSKSPS